MVHKKTNEHVVWYISALAKGDRLSKTNFTKDKDFGESIYNSCLGWETGLVQELETCKSNHVTGRETWFVGTRWDDRPSTLVERLQ